jgi:hypothetical protein
VRRYAKASFAGSTQGSGLRRGLFGLVCLCVLGLAALLGSGAPSAGAAGACPNEDLRYGYGAHLPDCRAYEMVTPVDKEGQEIATLAFGPMYPVAAADGEASSYQSAGTFDEANPTAGPVLYNFLARRGAGGWSSDQIDPPMGAPQGFGFGTVHPLAFTPNLGGYLSEGSPQSAVNPPGEEDTKHLFYRNNSIGSFQAVDRGLPEGLEGASGTTYQGVAADGSHVVFRATQKLTGEGGAGPYLYDWSAASETLTLLGENAQIARNGASGNSPHNVWHVVSADGSRIFTTGGSCGVGACVYVSGSPQHIGGTFWLANLGGTVAYVTEGGDLKRYDVNAGVLNPLTSGGEVQGVLGASEDGSRVYFVAKAVLAPGATAGQNNIYLWTEGGGVAFIATGLLTSSWSQSLPTSRVSANGMHLGFNSSNKLTGYENSGKTQIYAYDAGTGQLSCASCNPLATHSTQNTTISTKNQDSLPRNVSDNGQVFFETNEALVREDIDAVEDVYEYDSASGQISLISSGITPYYYPVPAGLPYRSNEFTDASASGSDVFYLTRDKLVGVDQDELTDLYDARVGGGLASQNPPLSTPPCTGEACHPEQSSPSQAGPPSATLVGKGNLSSKQNCNKLGKEAKKLSKRAKRLRKNANKAKKAGNASRAKQLNKKSNRLAKQARNKSKSAKKCRKRNRGASK